MGSRFRSRSVSIALIAFAAAAIAGFVVLDVSDAVFGAMLAAVVLIVAAVDIDRFEIPDLCNMVILALGLGWTMEVSDLDVHIFVESLTRTGLAALFLLTIRTVYRFLRQSEGLGLGDVKLAGAGASWLSWPNMTLALLIAAAAAMMLVIIAGVVKGEKVRATTAIPFGAFLAPSIWVAWFAQVAMPDWSA